MTAFKILKKEIKKESIGEQLKKARAKKELSLENAEEFTKIRIKYLKALEDEDWNIFPSEPYLKGFLKSYAEYLGIPWQPLLSQYKRERGVENSLKKKLLPPKKEVKYPKVYITPTLLAIIFLAVIILGVFVYIGYQVSGFASAPYLLIDSPNYGAVVSENPVLVEGKTSKGASLYINGQILPTDTEGNFKQEIKLKEGSNIITIYALNKAGKKTEKELIVIYQPQ